MPRIDRVGRYGSFGSHPNHGAAMASARPPPLVAHYSDFYPIMDDNDKRVYAER